MYLFRYAAYSVSIMMCLLSLPTMADTTTLMIPDQGWGVTFDSPPLRLVREADSNDHYMYSGNNNNNFAVSLYVDTPGCSGGNTHEDVLNCFWAKTGKDPLINQATVNKQCNSKYCKLSYTLENSFQEATIRQQHVVFLFAYRDRWANLRVAVSNPTESDLKKLATLESTLSYQ